MSNTPKHAPGYRPNPHDTQEDWDEVSDNPELTDEELANLRPAREVLPPELYAALAAKRQRGSQAAPTKRLVSLRLDADVIEHFKAQGPGWQTRINATLRRAMRRAAPKDAAE
jgi:uncharacterized protein (DUF4415 family)